ncbi:biotin-dependent carboxyltransferase family protein [Actinophytocola sp.]|uniref:5-oxoprolinase subunit C family protein n=1 Tax=Actinophytocola sp. TaxID=1872138 RepID=UPI002ED03C27
MTTLEITGTGWLTTFTDLGRRDAERLGVPTGGAADQHSAMVANLLVGNPRGATLIESLGSGLAFVPDRDVLLAVTGAPCRVTIGNAVVDTWSPVVAPAGQVVRVTDVRLGTRTYLAVHGDLRAPTFLGSAAPDARMGFGQVITRGTQVRLDTGFVGFPRRFPVFRLPVPALRFGDGPWVIDVVESPHSIPGIRELIEESSYVVTDRSNHVGLRLTGPVRHPDNETEIVSHGVPIGALEIPHADELIVLGRYRSLTAGYPIVGVASRPSLPLLGQAGPGQELRFRWIDREESIRRFARREDELRALERAAADALDLPCRRTQ